MNPSKTANADALKCLLVEKCGEVLRRWEGSKDDREGWSTSPSKGVGNWLVINDVWINPTLFKDVRLYPFQFYYCLIAGCDQCNNNPYTILYTSLTTRAGFVYHRIMYDLEYEMEIKEAKHVGFNWRSYESCHLCECVGRERWSKKKMRCQIK